jgi:signal transduction histidine kinase
VAPSGSEIALAAFVGLIGLITVTAGGLPIVGAAVSTVQVVALLLRPTAPRLVTAVLAASLPVGIAVLGGSSGVAWPAFAFLVGRHGGSRLLGAAFAAAIAATWGMLALRDGQAVAASWLPSAVALALVPLVTWALGRWRRAVAVRERQRAEAAERAQVAVALAAERSRIADDLGAVVLDELRRVTALAAGLRRTTASGPSAPVLAELQQSARRALAAMRRVLTVLRAADTAPAAVTAAPPRRWWEPRRPDVSGVLVAGVLTAMTVAGAVSAPSTSGFVARYLDLPPFPSPLLAVLAVQLAATAWWRTGPVPALMVVTAADSLLSLTGTDNVVADVGWFVVVYAAGSWAPVRASGPAVLISSIVLGAVGAATAGALPVSVPAVALTGSLTIAVLWGLGVLVRHVRLRAERTRAAEASTRLRHRLGDERHRIARDLHDLVAHHASAVAVQAAAARSDPGALAAAVDHIEDGGRRIAAAVGELAGLGPPVAVAPLSRAALERAVEPVRAAGLPVVVEVTGAPPAVAGEADLFAHRIVAEALTNVLRHAGPSPTMLRVTHGADTVDVEVRDGGVVAGHRSATAGSGLGLVGMRERAALLGGAVEAGPHEGGWRVRARLPRAVAEVTATPAV